MELALAWWNTSLSPAARSEEPTPDAFRVAESLAELMVFKLGIDLVALGEVSLEATKRIWRRLEPLGCDFLDASGDVGRARFDLGLVYRSSKLKPINTLQLVVGHGSRKLKLGYRTDFAMVGSEKPLHVIVSHWPSRLWMEQDHSDRHLLGARLRQATDEILDADADAQIVLMGDYNDEPFDRSLSEHLMATRDRNIASQRSHLFYNPFWRHLSPHDRPTASERVPHICGSYFHRGGSTTRWRTFDQIIVSSALLGRGQWEIDEQRTSILNIPMYTEIVLRAEHTFDHLPVVSALRRLSNG